MHEKFSKRICVVVIMGCLSAFVGCSTASSDGRATAEQQNAYDAGITAIKNREFDTAEKNLTTAITESHLSADLQEDAYLQRARARMELNKLDDAKADIDWLADRATNLDAVWIARGQLLQKKGDQAGASKAYEEARKINPNISIPKTSN